MFLELYSLPNTTTGIDNILIQAQAQVSILIPLLLTFTWFVVFLGGISRQKARMGTSDYAMWSTVASIACFLVSLFLSIQSGFIDVTTLVVVSVITIFSGVWLFLDHKQSEV